MHIISDSIYNLRLKSQGIDLNSKTNKSYNVFKIYIVCTIGTDDVHWPGVYETQWNLEEILSCYSMWLSWFYVQFIISLRLTSNELIGRFFYKPMAKNYCKSCKNGK